MAAPCFCVYFPVDMKDPTTIERSVSQRNRNNPSIMMKSTDLIYRDFFIPEWNSELEAFFNTALPELERYSEERGAPPWTTPAPEISEFDGFYEIRKELTGLEPESLFAEAIENVVILSGLRWCNLPKEENERLLFFRRVIRVPKCLDEESLRVHFRDEVEVILRVRERQTARKEPLGDAEKRQKTAAHARDKKGSPRARPGRPGQNGRHRVEPAVAGGLKITFREGPVQGTSVASRESTGDRSRHRRNS